jgi:hypothetical protein
LGEEEPGGAVIVAIADGEAEGSIVMVAESDKDAAIRELYHYQFWIIRFVLDGV